MGVLEGSSPCTLERTETKNVPDSAWDPQRQIVYYLAPFAAFCSCEETSHNSAYSELIKPMCMEKVEHRICHNESQPRSI